MLRMFVDGISWYLYLIKNRVSSWNFSALLQSVPPSTIPPSLREWSHWWFLALLCSCQLLCWVFLQVASISFSFLPPPLPLLHGLFLCFEMGSHYVAQVGLQLAMICLQTPEWWGYRCALPFLVTVLNFKSGLPNSWATISKLISFSLCVIFQSILPTIQWLIFLKPRKKLSLVVSCSQTADNCPFFSIYYMPGSTLLLALIMFFGF